MTEYKKVAFEVDRLIEAATNGEKTLEDIVANSRFSAAEIRDSMQIKTKEESKIYFEIALRLDVSPFWLMGYDVPKQQTAEERKFREALLALDEMVDRPALLEVVLRMCGFSKEEVQNALGDSADV